MALQKQTIPLTFTKGVDSKTDPRLSAKPSLLQNLVFRGGTLQKPYGASALTNTVDSGSITAGEALFAYDNELVRIDSGVCRGLSSAASKWVTKDGSINAATLFKRRLVRNQRTQTNADSVTVGSLTVLAWAETAAPQQGIHVAVFDEVTGTYFQSGNAAIASSTNGSFPRCVVVGTKVLVFWVDSGGFVYVAKVDTVAPATTPTASQIRTDYNASAFTASAGLMDAVTLGSFAVVAYNSTNSYTTTIIAVDSTGTVLGSPAPFTHAFASGTNNVGVALAVDSNSIAYLFLGNWNGALGSTTVFRSYNASFALQGSGVCTLGSFGDGDAKSMHLVSAYESATGTISAILQTGGAGLYTGSVTKTASNGFSPMANSTALRLVTGGVALNGVGVLGVCNNSSIQPTAYLMDFSGNLIARGLSGLTDVVGGERISRPQTVSSVPGFLFPERGRLSYTSSSGKKVDVTPRGITRCELTPVSAGTLPINRVGDTVYIGGALPLVYDGVRLVDAGFCQPPEGISVSATGSGGLSAGTYSYRALFSWVNARGELVRSPPSPSLSVTANANDSKTISVSGFPLDLKDAVSANSVQVELYRTEANGTLLYRTSSASVTSNPFFGGVYSVSIVDSTSDANLISGELLYTTGGVFDNIAPPPHKYAAVHKDRLILAGLEDPFEWRCSSQRIVGEMLRFNEDWGGRVPSTTGPITGLAVLDEKLIIFTSQTFYVVPGDGPDLLGNNGYGPPELVTSADTGCQNAASIVTMPDGVVFQGGKGLCLLDRNLQTAYFGADVETYGQYTMRSATLRAEVEQVWIHCDNGDDTTAAVLVWDYHYGQWSVLTGVSTSNNFAARDATYYQGKYTRVRADGTVLQETVGAYLLAGASMSSKVVTEWVKTDAIQGVQRVSHVNILGAMAGGTFTLALAVDYDFDTASTVTTSTAISGTNNFQLRRELSLQKCEAVRFTISDSSISADGRGLSLTALALEVGLRPGLYKLGAVKSI